MRFLFVLLILFFQINVVKSQNFITSHFDESDGIYSKFIYSINQSPDGFIWIGTDLGLYRFDGQNFKHFLIDDGLSDNEILDCLITKDNLMYFVSFNGRPCYNYKNKFYNKTKDTSLNSIKFNTLAVADINNNKDEIFTYSKNNNIFFKIKLEKNNVTIKKFPVPNNSNIDFIVPYKQNKLLVFYSTIDKRFCSVFNNDKFEKNIRLSNTINRNPNLIVIQDSIYSIEEENIIKYEINEKGSIDFIKKIPLEFKPNKFFKTKNGFWITSYEKGAYYFETEKLKYYVHINCNVNYLYEDVDSNIWLGTVNEGLYYLKKSKINNFKISNSNFTNNIENIASIENEILISDKHFIFNKNKKEIFNTKNNTFIEEIKFIHPTLIKKEFFAVANNNFVKINTLTKKIVNYKIIGAIKSIVNIDKIKYFIATSGGLLKLNINENGYKFSPIWNHRTTKLYLDKNNNLWIGTLNSLYFLKNNSTNVLPFIDKRMDGAKINSFTSENDTIIVATDKGIFIINNFQIVETISKKNILANDNCLNIVAHKNKLYVINSNGLNILEKDKNNKWFSSNFISTNDGILSNQINNILIENDTIYLATNKGLSFFYENNLIKPQAPLINILSVNSNNKEFNKYFPIKIKSKEKNISINFTGISFQCSKNISYKYRLLNNSKNWIFTKEKSVSFFELTPGKYTFEVIAINEKGQESLESAKIDFEIIPTFWQTIWFKILMFCLVIFSGYYLYLLRIRFIKKQESTKADFDNRLSQIELEAIKAQINPHFIYNCLNSIQNSILKNDIKSSSLQISLFSKLIRETLNLSKQNFISLAEEINYLNMYLQMEKIRFKEKLNFNITCKNIKNENDIEIPSMLLQPFVENAVKHGLSNNNNINSSVSINFNILNETLYCTIEDNGIGINTISKNIDYKGVQVGLQNINNRVETYNKLFNSKISLEINDKKNEGGTGTIIKILIPLKHLI